MKVKIRETLKRYKRVIILMRRPTIEELKRLSKICALGFIVVGLMGFFFYMISVLSGV